MNLSLGSLAGLLACLLGGVALVSGVLPPLAIAALATPFALLIPIGVGLYVCFGWRASIPPGIGRVQALLIAWFVGTLAIIYIFVLLERYGFTGNFSDLALISICLLAALGFLRLWHAFSLDLADQQTLRLLTIVASPLLIFQYSAEIFIYSDFPVLDLFQRSHFHKGALEFAKYGILNPFASDSYVPFQQLLLGLLARGVGVDPLVAEWVLPLAMSPLQVGAIYVVAKCMTKSNSQLALVVGLFLATYSVTNPTNGMVAFLGALLLLSLLLVPSDEDGRVREQLTVTLFGLAVIAACTALMSVQAGTGFVVLIGAALLTSMLRVSVIVTRAMTAAIVIFTVLSFHRSSMFFLPMVTLICLSVSLGLSVARRKSGGMWLLGAFILALMVVLSMVGYILLLGKQQVSDEFGLWPVFDFFLIPLIDKSMANIGLDFDLRPGAGARIAMFEVARSFSIVCGVMAGFLLFRVMWLTMPFRQPAINTERGEALSIILLLVFLILTALFLVGFPFLYRAAPILPVLLSIVTARLLIPLKVEEQRWGLSKIVVSVVLLLYMGLILTFVLLADVGAAEPFFDRAFPLLLMILCGGVALIIWSCRKKSKSSLAIAIVIAVLFEGIASRAYFKPYAFSGQEPPANAAVSYFGHQELDTANRIAKELSIDTILISDPKTMALLSSRSGLSSIVSFSNLNTMTDKVRKSLTSFLRSVDGGATELEICSKLESIMDSEASSSVNYIAALRGGGSGNEALSILGYSSALLPQNINKAASLPQNINKAASLPQNFAIVFSHDSVDWMSNPISPSYFPVQGNSLRIADIPLAARPGSEIIGNAVLLKLRCK